MRTRYISLLVILLVGLFTVTAQAGDPDSPGGPASTTSYTLDDLYNRLRDGTTGSPRPFTEPTNGPGSRTMRTLDELMDVAPAPDGANGAMSGQVLIGTTYWSLRGENWGTAIGTMPDRGALLIVPGVWTKTIPSGYHNGGGIVRGDQNLQPANILSGTTIFKVEGAALEASGAATAGQVLTGVSFSNANGPAVGSMPNNGAIFVTPTTRTVAIPAGYHNGSGQIFGDGDLVSGNILSGTTIFEVEGAALEASGVATAGQVLTGVSFSNANGPAVGAMPDNGAIFVTPTTRTVAIPAGYHNGSGQIFGDGDLVSGNILSGTTIFEVEGTVLEASGVATAGQVLTGVSFSNANGPAVGALPDNGAIFVTPTTRTVAIPAGYHNGSGQIFGDGDLVSGNILSGTTIFEVEGTVLEASGVATAGQVLTGVSFSNANGPAVGAMPDNGAIFVTPTTRTVAIPAGYHNGSGQIFGDGDLVSGNILSGTTIFEVEGTVLEASGVATAGQVLTGVSFSNANGPAVGALPDNGAIFVTPTTRTVAIPAGYHNGSGQIFGDGDLVSGNILSGTTIFEVEGTVLEASGVATAGQVLTGVSFSNANGPAVGAMPDNGAIFVTPTTRTVAIPAGYHNGSGQIFGDGDLVSGNILSGTTIFEVEGTVLEASGVATAGQVLTGVSFSNANGPAVGAMPDNGAIFVTPTTRTVTIPAGYHNGSGQIFGDGDLVSGNILSGTTIFEVEGTALGASGVATAGQVLTGVSFSNADGPAVGSMPDNGAIFVTPTTRTVAIPAGYHNGSGQIFGDGDLVSGNILSGTTIFEVEGTVLEASGVATAGQVLTGVSFSNANGPAVGALPDNGAIFVTPTTRTVAIPAGYHNGSGQIFGDGDLVSGNILSGTTIFEVEGTALEVSGVATTGQVLTGVSFSNADGPAVGAMPDNGAIFVTPTTETVTIPAGYHSGSGLVSGDPDLQPGNILSGTTIFKVEGTALEVSGVATAGQVLTGVSFSNADGPAVGSMPDNGAIFVTPTTETVTIPAGYHNGGGLIFGDGDLVSGNILSGTTIFEVEGTALEASGVATTGQVLTGVSFSNADGPAVGSMPDNGAIFVTPTTETVTIPAGYHNGGGLIFGDGDLVSGNILSGTTIFEVEGTALEASGVATTGQVLTGVSFSNADGPAVGSMPDNGAIFVTPTTETVTIPAGYHNGGGLIFGDGDLASGNILSGTTIFEVEGTALEVSGVATTGQVLTGVSFSNADGPAVGSMPDNGAIFVTPTTRTVAIPAGYHNGSGQIFGDGDLVSGNILSGTTIFEVEGTVLEASGVATAGQVLTGVSFSNADGPAVGSMPDNGAISVMPTTRTVTIPAGYHNGSGQIFGDGDLASGNILNSVNIFGINGSVIRATGVATSGQVLGGVAFSNASGAGIGGMPDNGTVVITPSTVTVPIALGFHDGSGLVIGDADLKPANIVSGMNIFGINGSAIRATGLADPQEVLAGISFSNAGGAATGTMPNRGAVIITPTTTAQTIAAGYHSGSGSVVGDSDLIAGNILTGKNIFGIGGSVIQASGSATAGQVLTGISFSNAGGAVTGSMPNRGAVIITPTTTAQTIAAGYHNGSGSVVGDSDLIAGNILTGKNIFGIGGSVIQASGVATAGQVLTGISFSNAGGAVTGSMPNRGAVTITPTTTAQTIAAGYHSGSGSVVGDSDLIAGNILTGKNIFGIGGSVIQASGSATAGQVLTGVPFSNVGGAATGTMPDRGAVTITPTTTAQTIAAGYHSGSGSVVGDSDLIAGNILGGISIFGVNGSITNRGAVTITPTTTAQTIAAGYHSGSGSVVGDSDLIAGNILTGKNIFGVNGSVIQATGVATAGQVLTGISFSNAGGAVTGSMPNRGAVIITPTTTAQTIAAGYHSGSGSVVGDSDLIAGNILTGKNIFGVNGSVIQATGVATAGQVLTGISFSNAGGAVTGSMPNRGAVIITPTTTAQTIAAGYHSGSGSVVGDSDLIAGNILGGISIFGVNGSITNRGAVTITPTTTAQTIAAGYHSGSGSVVGDSDLIAGNILTGKNIFGISGSVIQASGVATAGQVLTGISFSNAGGAATGTMPNRGAVTITPSSSQQAIPAGYHNGSGSVVGDSDLIAGNILTGKNIFGVTGTYPVAAVAKTGVTKNTYPNDDAQLQRGVSWPVPRFTNNGDGTVTDNLTGLVWLRNPTCFSTKTLSEAITLANLLNSGQCGLTDGSTTGEWRVPNIHELDSLIYFGGFNPVVSNSAGTGIATEGDPFLNVSTYKDLDYWSSHGLTTFQVFM